MNLADYYHVLNMIWDKDPKFFDNSWITWHLVGDELASEINTEGLSEKYSQLVMKTRETKDPQLFFQTFFIYNELYRNGVKIIKPTFEQCVVLENIEPKVTLE